MQTTIDPAPAQTVNPTHAPGVNNRLFGLLSAFLSENTLIPAMYHGVILNFVKPYLQKTSESELAEQIEKLRDQIIPFILFGK